MEIIRSLGDCVHEVIGSAHKAVESEYVTPHVGWKEQAAVEEGGTASLKSVALDSIYHH